MLGAMIKATGMLSYDKVLEGVEYFFSKKPQLIDINKKMFDVGYNYIK